MAYIGRRGDVCSLPSPEGNWAVQQGEVRTTQFTMLDCHFPASSISWVDQVQRLGAVEPQEDGHHGEDRRPAQT
jgi:hypothetical protein